MTKDLLGALKAVSYAFLAKYFIKKEGIVYNLP